jgi:hypothetical protein
MEGKVMVFTPSMGLLQTLSYMIKLLLIHRIVLRQLILFILKSSKNTVFNSRLHPQRQEPAFITDQATLATDLVSLSL